jgi:rRNA-processing protein FCF1
MLDTNIFDCLLDDPEAASELMNRRDLRLLVTPVQLDELTAVPDPARRERLHELAATLCATISGGIDGDRAAGNGDRAQAVGDRVATMGTELARHGADNLITAAAKRGCDLLVSNDQGLLEHTMEEGLRVMDWTMFLRRVVFSGKRRV